jgi:nitrogen regulatory protein P-II 1
MKEIKAIIQPSMFEPVLDALEENCELPGMTVSEVIGWGDSPADQAGEVTWEGHHTFVKKTKIEIVLTDEAVDSVVDVIARATRTGKPGDGKIFVFNVGDVVKIQTGERGVVAL